MFGQVYWSSNNAVLIYQPFGYLLHPLFKAVGGNLQLYQGLDSRRVGIQRAPLQQVGEHPRTMGCDHGEVSAGKQRLEFGDGEASRSGIIRRR